MKFRLAVFTMLVLLSSASLSAQLAVPIKVDEFGNTNCDDYRARLDFSLTEVIEKPQAEAYVLIYEGDVEKPITDRRTMKTTGFRFVRSEIGFAKDLIKYFKQHVAFRNFPADRITFLNAGFRDRFVVEVWLVPDGAEPPKASPTLTTIKQQKRTKKPWGFCGEM